MICLSIVMKIEPLVFYDSIFLMVWKQNSWRYKSILQCKFIVTDYFPIITEHASSYRKRTIYQKLYQDKNKESIMSDLDINNEITRIKPNSYTVQNSWASYQ